MSHLTSGTVLASLLCATLTAQIPAPNILVAESGATHELKNVISSGPGTGTATTLSGTANRNHSSVALDSDPQVVWGIGNWPVISGIPVAQYQLSGNAATRGPADGTVNVVGTPARCHRYGQDLFFTVNDKAAGLYRRSISGGAAQLVYRINHAFDIAVLNGKVYVTTWEQNQAKSELWEVDLSGAAPSAKTITLDAGSLVPPQKFKALATYGWEGNATYLLLGGDQGKLWWVDPTLVFRNCFTTTFGTPQGVAEAIALHPDRRIGVVVATQSGLYTQSGYNTGGSPFYKTSNTIRDIAVLGGGMESFGSACAGAAGEPRFAVDVDGWPHLGNANFGFGLADAAAQRTALLVLGTSRSTWGAVSLPLKLDVMGASGCFLNVEMLLVTGLSTDAQGEARQGAPIPNQASLRGQELYAQWAVAEPGANPAGLVSTAGLRLVLR